MLIALIHTCLFKILNHRVGDHILEINGVLVVNKTVTQVRNFLGWIPRRKRVTITAVARSSFLHLISDDDKGKQFVNFLI